MTQPEAYDEERDEPDLGPDERDMDLLDGTWEEDFYAGRVRTRDWRGITIGISLLVIAAMVLSVFAVLR
jgi:hypothetical protein